MRTISGGTRHYQSFCKAGTEPVAWPCLCRDSEGSPRHELVYPRTQHHTRGLRPRAPPLWDVESTWWAVGVVVWGWNPGEARKEGSTGCFEDDIAEQGWVPAACLAWSPPTAENPHPCRSCYHPLPPITCRNSPPFSPSADVLWLRFRKITTPILDTVDTSFSGTRSEEGICHALIKANFPCTQSLMDCRARNNHPVSINTGRLCCHCAEGDGNIPIYTYISLYSTVCYLLSISFQKNHQY